jgi:hypothetical protein
MKKNQIFAMSFASVYPHYITKAEKKGKTKEDVHTIITWLTGYTNADIDTILETKIDFETFFEKAPKLNPNVDKIKGLICGYRVEDIEDPLMQKIRFLDKLIDELARGKKMESILRS